MSRIFLQLFVLLLSVSVVLSASSCLCGCCPSGRLGLTCPGNSNWQGWASLNTAPCNGTLVYDIALCNQICSKTYPNSCPTQSVLSTCQPTATDEPMSTLAQGETHTRAIIPLAHSQPPRPSSPSSSSHAGVTITSSLVSWNTSFDSDVSLSLQKMALNSTAATFPFYLDRVCQCFTNDDQHEWPVTLGFVGIPRTLFDPVNQCSPLCAMGYLYGLMPYPCGYHTQVLLIDGYQLFPGK